MAQSFGTGLANAVLHRIDRQAIAALDAAINELTAQRNELERRAAARWAPAPDGLGDELADEDAHLDTFDLAGRHGRGVSA